MGSLNWHVISFDWFGRKPLNGNKFDDSIFQKITLKWFGVEETQS